MLGSIQSLWVSVMLRRALLPLQLLPSTVTVLFHVVPVSKMPVYQSFWYTQGILVYMPVSQS